MISHPLGVRHRRISETVRNCSRWVITPGRGMIVDRVTMAISCWGFSLSMFGRIVHNRGSDMMVPVTLALVSLAGMFHPNDTWALWAAGGLLPAMIYGTQRPPDGRPPEEGAGAIGKSGDSRVEDC